MKNWLFRIGLPVILIIYPHILPAATVIYPGGTGISMSMQNGTARAIAMGSAYTGMAQGSSALLWNPAGLGALSGMEIGCHHNSGLGGVIQETVVLGLGVGNAGGFGASIDYVNNGVFEKRDGSGNLLPGENTAAEIGGRLGWGKQILPGLYAGAAIKAGRKTLAGKEYFSYAGDAGVLWEAAPFLKFGASYINIAGKTGDDAINAALRAGASLNIGTGGKNSVALAASGEAGAGGLSSLNAGFEATGQGILSVRCGYMYNFTKSGLEGLTGITAGIGIKLQGMALDYAYAPFGELGDTHRVSLTFAVTAPEPAPEIKRTILPQSDIRVISFEEVHFEHDKADITPRARVMLEKNILILKDIPEAEVRIAGHTSLSGSKAYNKKLSEKRAVTIRNFLIREGGIAPERLFIIGYGDTNPVAEESNPGETDSGAARLNRRGVFQIIRK